ncbi:MAG: flagellar hook-basal body complex protein FliE [Solirubrobacteraceae bacterium]
MIIPPVGGLQAGLTGAAEGATQASPAAPAEGLVGTAAEGTSSSGATSGATPSFGTALTEAISSLESSQQSADSASQALATGSVTDPESAVTTVEDASLEMQLADQIRTKATDAVQTIFQTQV